LAVVRVLDDLSDIPEFLAVGVIDFHALDVGNGYVTSLGCLPVGALGGIRVVEAEAIADPGLPLVGGWLFACSLLLCLLLLQCGPGLPCSQLLLSGSLAWLSLLIARHALDTNLGLAFGLIHDNLRLRTI